MNAFFTLEQGFNVNSGAVNNAAASLASNSGTAAQNHFTTGANSALNGQMFNRGAFVGLSKDGLGTISFGRQTAFVWDDETKFDPVFDAQLFSPLGNSGTYGGGVGSSDSSRWDNSVKYKNTYGDFNYGAMYKFGGVAGSTSNGQAYGFTAGYDKGPLALQFSYQSETDAPVSAINTITNGTVAGSFPANMPSPVT
jgi:predicted porin